MVKIFSLLALAVVVSACGNALSAPVSEESTKETTSDSDASTLSKSKNIRGAEAGDLFAKDDGEERALGGNWVKDAGAWMKALLSAKSTNGLNKGKSQWTEPSVKSEFSRLYDPLNPKVRKAIKLINAGKSQDEIAKEGVSVTHYLRALLRKVKNRDKLGQKDIVDLTEAYYKRVASLNKDFKALDDGVAEAAERAVLKATVR